MSFAFNVIYSVCSFGTVLIIGWSLTQRSYLLSFVCCKLWDCCTLCLYCVHQDLKWTRISYNRQIPDTLPKCVKKNLFILAMGHSPTLSKCLWSIIIDDLHLAPWVKRHTHLQYIFISLHMLINKYLFLSKNLGISQYGVCLVRSPVLRIRTWPV